MSITVTIGVFWIWLLAIIISLSFIAGAMYGILISERARRKEQPKFDFENKSS